jgi:tetratricopeptide (TPR) repeat protein
MRSGSTWLAAILLHALLPSALAAQAEMDARARFEAGTSAFAAHDYTAALEHFRAAFELVPRAAVRFNIAVCLERLARFREAIAEYEAAARSEELDAGGRARAEAQRARIEPWLAHLRVEGDRTGAAVLVDGEERCALPCEIAIDPRRQIVIVRDGEDELTRTIEPERGAAVALRFDRPPVEPPPPPPGGSLSALGAIGIGIAALGIGGTIGFGLRAQDRWDAFDRTPSDEIADEGELMRDLANVSIAAIGVGALLVAIDVFFLAGFFGSSAPARANARGLVVDF